VKLGDDLLHSFNEWRRHITSRPPEAQLSSVVGESPAVPQNVTVMHRSHIRIDAEQRKILLDDTHGTCVYYDKCLIATAGKPRKFYVLDRYVLDCGESQLYI
jgi:apoptosis-inducing factor 1